MKTFKQLREGIDDPDWMKKLTIEEKRLVISALNHLGSGQHPVADGQNLKHFKVDYVKQIVRAAIPKVTDDFTAILWGILKKLK